MRDGQSVKARQLAANVQRQCCTLNSVSLAAADETTDTAALQIVLWYIALVQIAVVGGGRCFVRLVTRVSEHPSLVPRLAGKHKVPVPKCSFCWIQTVCPTTIQISNERYLMTSHCPLPASPPPIDLKMPTTAANNNVKTPILIWNHLVVHFIIFGSLFANHSTSSLAHSQSRTP